MLVDDNEMFIRLVTRFLNQSPANLRVVASCTEGRLAPQRVRRLQPDLVLLDLAMPDMHGLIVLARLRVEFPRLPVVVLSLMSTTFYSNTVMEKGACGFVDKATMYADLIPVINRAMVTAGQN
ncbi:MAG: hypothetical protein Kow0031_36120 [Anaerolineae bacterium]